MILDAFQLPFFERAVLVGLLVSVACGIIGSYVVVKRIASISGGISHAAFGGVGLGYYFGFSPILGAFFFSLFSALVIGVVFRRQRQSLDTLITMMWSLGMALGMLFIALTPGYAPDLMSYLFGSIILVPQAYLPLIAVLDAGIVLVVFLFSHQLRAVCFDEEFCEVMGLPVSALFLLLLALSTVVVIMLIQVVGVILTIALLTTPAVIARHWSRTLTGMMFLSSIVAALCITSGLFLSYWFSADFGLDLPIGPVIILLATALYAASSVLRIAAGKR